MLPAADLVGLLRRVDDTFGLDPDAEVTTEANPESVTPAYARGAARGRLHPDQLRNAVGEPACACRSRSRAHPGRAEEAVAEARAAGFEHINVDLIYGTPGESDDGLAGITRCGVDDAAPTTCRRTR